jgi:hypothetical protein
VSTLALHLPSGEHQVRRLKDHTHPVTAIRFRNPRPDVVKTNELHQLEGQGFEGYPPPALVGRVQVCKYRSKRFAQELTGFAADPLL